MSALKNRSPLLGGWQLLANSWCGFFVAQTSVTGAVVFRTFLALWTIGFYWERLDHAWEIYSRPVLRAVSPRVAALGYPVPDQWLAELTIIALILLLLGFAFSPRPRICHVLLMFPLTLLTEFDTLMGRAYGQLAYVQWWLLFLVPYDRHLSSDRDVITAPRLGVRLLQLQWASVYFFTVLAKANSGTWFDGSALWAKFHGERLGQWLLSDWFDIPRSVATALGYTTLACEWFIAIGIFFSKTRVWAMLSCLLLHLGILLTVRVSVLFSALMWGHLLLFVTDEEWQRLFRKAVPREIVE